MGGNLPTSLAPNVFVQKVGPSQRSLKYGAVNPIAGGDMIMHDLYIPLERPLRPLPMPPAARATLDPLGLAGVMEPLCEAGGPEVPPREEPLPLPLAPRDDFVAVFSSLLRSSSSAFLARASRRCTSSCSRLSFSCCSRRLSFSRSAISCVAPCHEGSRIKRWLCSV